jgi:hypothetical protein
MRPCEVFREYTVAVEVFLEALKRDGNAAAAALFATLFQND